MKSEILTSHLLKLINPSKDGILYSDQNIKIDLKKLKGYVDAPKKNQVFTLSGNVEDDLHKNLALYIINSDDEPKFISLDLNSPTVFTPDNGLFEFIKVLYNKEQNCYINIKEDGDNLLFIKSKKITPLEFKTSFKDAEDIHYANLASVFSDTTKIDIKKLRGQVTWQEDNSDRYANHDFVIGKINEIFDVVKRSDRDNPYEAEFKKLIELVNTDLLKSDKFKLGLLDLNHDYLNQILVSKFIINSAHKKEQSDTLYIDFSQPQFQFKIMEQVKNGETNLLSEIFNLYLKQKRSLQYTKNPNFTPTIDFSLFVNQPKCIEYLEQQYFYTNSRYEANEKFCAVSVYPFLTEENKTNQELVDKYISLIKDSSYSRSYTYVNEDLLYELSPKVFSNKDLLLKLIKENLDYSKLKKFLDSNNVDYSNIINKDFVLSTNLDITKIEKLIYNFIDKKDLTLDFFKNLIQNKPDFYDKLQNNPSWSKFYLDMDIIETALNRGLSISEIEKSTMSKLLLKEHKLEHERIKIKYLIATQSIYNVGNPKYYFGSENETTNQKLKEKYLKVEYLFYKTERSFSDPDVAKKILSKINSSEEVINVLNTIKANNKYYDFQFNSQLFYDSLKSTLKKDKKIASAILDMGPLRYVSLDEHLAYNTDIVIKCLKQSREQIKQIPNELFTNSKFALEIAKFLDSEHLEMKDMPVFINKFFANQEVTENYRDYLELHLNYKDMQKDLEIPNATPTSKSKKMKI